MSGGVVLRAFDWQGWDVTDGSPMDIKPQYLWMGKTTSDSLGQWSINLDGVNFEEVLSVNATVKVNGNGINDMALAVVRSVNNSTITGHIVSPNQGLFSLGLLFNGWKFNAANLTVFVQVFGRSPK